MHEKPPAAVISHVHGKNPPLRWDLLEKPALDEQLDSGRLQPFAGSMVQGLADPTDRPIDSVSSADNGLAGEDAQDASPVGDEQLLFFRKLDAPGSFHRLPLPRPGASPARNGRCRTGPGAGRSQRAFRRQTSADLSRRPGLDEASCRRARTTESACLTAGAACRPIRR